MTATERLPVMLTVGTDPPTEFRIFRAGVNETLKGDVLFDEVAAESVMKAAADWATHMSLDYEHDALNPSLSGPRIAAGWYHLAVRDGELWAVNVEWTERAAAHIRAREYRYISPSVMRDRETGRALELVNCALTNLPATKGLTPLVANRGLAEAEDIAMPATPKKTVVKLADEPTIDQPAPEAPAAEEPKSDPAAECAAAIKACIAACDECLKACAVMTVDASADEAHKAAAQTCIDACNTHKAALSEALSAFEPAAEEVPADAQMTASILALTGAKSVVAALGVIAAGKAALDELTALRAKQAEQAKLSADQERAALIEKLSTEKRITPAQRQWAQTVDLAALKSFAGVAPVLTALASTQTIEPAKGSDKRWEDYSTIELHKLAHEKPEIYAALKADRDQRRASR